MKKLNILVNAYACNPLATPESYPGEAIDGWNQVRQISRFHKLTVLTRIYNKKALEETLKKGEIRNIDFHFIDLPDFIKTIRKNYYGFRIYYWLWQIKAYFIARKLSENYKFDVFHHVTFHNDWMPSYIGAYLNIPFIWGPVGGGQKVPPIFYSDLSFMDILKEISRIIFQEFWRHTPTRLIGMKKAKAVLVCNTETRKKVEKFSNKVYDFPVNGIATEDLCNKEQCKKTDNKFRVLCTGRLVYWKAISLGIRAFSLFNKKYSDSIFEIIGEGADERRINREIEKLGIRKFAKLIPWLPREKLLEKMRQSDVFLYPSLREGGGAVVVEAMASRLPVICIDYAGPGFHIKDECGIKIEPKNPGYVVEEMAKALERLYLDDDLRNEMGRRGRERAEEYYLWDKLGERLQRIYEEVLDAGD